jgi:hypothetical protein
MKFKYNQFIFRLSHSKYININDFYYFIIYNSQSL